MRHTAAPAAGDLVDARPRPDHQRQHRPDRRRHGPRRRSITGWVVLLLTLVVGAIAVMAVAAILAMVLLLAVFDFDLGSSAPECESHPVGILQAAYFGDVDGVRQGIDAGDLDRTDSDGRTAMYCAARGGQAEVVAQLAAAGGDPDVRNDAGDTALLWAAQEGSLETVDALLAAGADVDLATDAGHTPLLRAVYGGHAAVVDRLLEAGADPDLGGGADSLTTVMLVSQVVSGEPLEPGADPLAGGANVDPAMPATTGTAADNITPLHAAAAMGHTEIARSLLLAGADPDVVALAAYTPLHVVALVGDAEMATLLLFGSADPAPAGLESPAELARRRNHPAVADVIERSSA
jgi:uncharacterized protein